ncbi:hypothetical protein [Dactylosporangium cerinum]
MLTVDMGVVRERLARSSVPRTLTSSKLPLASRDRSLRGSGRAVDTPRATMPAPTTAVVNTAA